MLKRLEVQNFRSIQTCEVSLGPITVLFGPTASGKSTLFYALLVLRNFVLNSNQSLDGLFNLGFQNLGGFEACVFNHELARAISILADFGCKESPARYGINLGKSETEIALDVDSISLSEKVSVPYGLNQSWASESSVRDREFAVNWNGLTCTVAPKSPDAASQSEAAEIATKLNAPVEALRRIDVCPHRRGFFKPNYTSVPLTPTPTGEDEVATIIINDLNLPSRVSLDTDDIFNRDFRIQTPPGTATTYFLTTEKKGRTPTYLVNDGFGVNQVIYMLAKIHRPEVESVLIEEPEVHLHPTVIRKFARVACRLAKEESKQLIFTTHSEQLLISLLACVAEGILAADDLCCYHVEREGRKSVFERQAVSSDGRIEGGLAAFMTAELEDLKKFLAIDK